MPFQCQFCFQACASHPSCPCQHHGRGCDMGGGLDSGSVDRGFTVLLRCVPDTCSLESRTFVPSCTELGVSCSCSLLCEVFPHFLNSREAPPRSRGWKHVQSCCRGHVPQFCVTGPTFSVEHGEETRVLLPWSSCHRSFFPRGGFCCGFWLQLCNGC